MYNSLQLRVLITIFMNTLDQFEEVTWVVVPAFDRAEAIVNGADRLVQITAALFQEAFPYAAPTVHNASVSIEADCVSCTAHYENIIVQHGKAYAYESPDLHELVVEKSKEVKSDLVDLLTDLAAAHFDGTASEGGCRYVIRNRG